MTNPAEEAETDGDTDDTDDTDSDALAAEPVAVTADTTGVAPDAVTAIGCGRDEKNHQPATAAASNTATATATADRRLGSQRTPVGAAGS
jgi:hypothetical protein